MTRVYPRATGVDPAWRARGIGVRSSIDVTSHIRLPATLVPSGYAARLACPDEVASLWRAAIAALGQGEAEMVGRYLHGAVVCAGGEPSEPRTLILERVPGSLVPAATLSRLLSDPSWGAVEAPDGNLWRLFRVTFVVLTHLLTGRDVG